MSTLMSKSKLFDRLLAKTEMEITVALNSDIFGHCELVLTPEQDRYFKSHGVTGDWIVVGKIPEGARD